MAEGQTYRPDIDGLRAVAVLAVLFYHAFPLTVRFGFIGVDVFFVISGYLITQQLLQPGCSIKQFYIRRIRRLFPALIAVMLATFAFGWFALFPSELEALGKHMLGGAGFVANLLYWGESGYFDTPAMTKPLRHLWSLGIEEQFYLLWPLMLLVLTRSKPLAPLGVALLLTASFAANLLLKEHGALDYYSPFTRFWELLLGAVLVFASPQQNRLAETIIACMGMCLCVAAAFLITDGVLYPGVHAALPTLGSALLIAGGQAALPNRLLAWRPLPALGRISYPLYLWHWPLFAYATVILPDTLSLTLRLTLLGAAFLLAAATARWIEQPLRFRGNPLRRVQQLLLAMVLVAIVGFAAYATRGFPERSMIYDTADNAKELVRPDNTDVACLKAMGWSKPPITYCRYRDVGGKQTVALIGDSFAHAAFTGVADMLAPHGVNTLLLGNAGCPPISGQIQNNFCQEQRTALFEALKARHDIARVVLITNASNQLMNESWTTENPNLYARQWLGGMQASIDRFRASGIKVYTLIENPTTGIHAQQCIERPFRRHVNACVVPRADIDARLVRYRWLVHQLRHTTVIDAVPLFCPDTQCHMLRNGVLLYADDAHLSVSGSRLQAEELLKPYLTR